MGVAGGVFGLCCGRADDAMGCPELGAAMERDQLKEEKEAIISLLYTDLVFVGSHWEDFPNSEKGCWPVLCAHTNSYGADAEEIPTEEIIPLAALVKQFGRDAIEGWVAFRRGTDKPQKGNMPPDGKRALDYLRAQSNSEL